MLLRDHVFDIQQFDAQPERLWRLISARLRLADARRLAAEGRYLGAMKLSVGAAMSSPRGAAGYLSTKMSALFR
jgi:hypothetical protein